MKLLITGGAGFIGSALVRLLIQSTKHEVIIFDKLTYAGNLKSLAGYTDSPRCHFVQGDISDASLLQQTLKSYSPDAIMHLAAESHVDRSIDGPLEFIQTNVVGTFHLLNEARSYWDDLSEERKKTFRFHHISTDEVYGDLEDPDSFFLETTPYQPSSPYSASKAGSDHLVRAWGRTYGLPILITNCSNNYGPYQFPEKLMPHIILNALAEKKLPIYGDGSQVRDWLYVDDHARALLLVLSEGEVGETYNIGGHNEQKNITVVKTICDLLADITGSNKDYTTLITHVEDRKGHDTRYAIDATKIERELGWTPTESFSSGLRKTVVWYLENEPWWRGILDGSYKLTRLGTQA